MDNNHDKAIRDLCSPVLKKGQRKRLFIVYQAGFQIEPMPLLEAFITHSGVPGLTASSELIEGIKRGEVTRDDLWSALHNHLSVAPF